jgi:alpha-D-ribose 1-methylphosphonate 5-triphosphate synthase subunit PhnH
MSMPVPERSVAELFTDLSQQLSTLFRQEALLARTEITQRLQAFAKDAVVIGVGAALGLAALMAATAAIVLLLVQLNITPWIAATLTAVLLAIVAGVLVQARLSAMRKRTIAPVETVESIKETAQWIKKETVGSSTNR